ncbi:uncharacterized protein N7515_009749 [Penicillium bovifimosum]|uniref:Uncharacterized protein n=1 Tax=Penicillium bovifimosum TaxID=126998 RepID=A0A9W9GHI8_9EURO|nr:uncharacterized protein N7515_009749 [Penicillium bovifimosum]KAJ5120361.1 hypothetical protein N7515_009749 [Penicillium bovifimosum]
MASSILYDWMVTALNEDWLEEADAAAPIFGIDGFGDRIPGVLGTKDCLGDRLGSRLGVKS